MKHWIKAPLLALFALTLVTVLGTNSACAAVDGDYRFYLSDGKATIEKYSGPGGDVVIPSMLSDGENIYPVNAISSDAFKGNASLSSVTIPEGVIAVSGSAFKGCSALASVSLPSSLNYIGQNAFDGTAIAEISLPSGLHTIEKEAFARCANLTSVSVPDACTRLEMGAFLNCASLKSARLSSGLTSVPAMSFKGCTALTSVSMPSSVTYIGVSAFEGCSSLPAIALHEGLKILDEASFRGCSSLTGVKFPNSLARLNNYVFTGCTNLGFVEVPGDNYVFARSYYYSTYGSGITKVRVRAGSTSLADKMFQNCYDLEAVELPQGLTSIGAYAFENCVALTSLQLPNSLTQIGEAAFLRCSGFTQITLPNGLTKIGYNAFGKCVNLQSVTVPESVTNLGEFAFSGCTNLASAKLPSSLTTIPASLFSWCSQLSTLTIPSGVKSIGTFAFSKSGLEGIAIPSGVTTLGDSVFADCAKLQSISLPAGLNAMGRSSFEGCEALLTANISCAISALPPRTFFKCYRLKTVTLPTGLVEIGSYAFWDCQMLNGLGVPASLKIIRNNAFESCSALTELNVPDSVTEIGSCAFFGCFGLSSFNWPASCPGIESGTFEVTGLTSITLPSSVTKIGSRAFYGCSKLESITLPSSVKTIEEVAFQGCKALKELVVPDGVTSIPRAAFGNMTLERLVLPGSVTSIDKDAFYLSTSVKSIALPGRFALTSFLSSAQLQQVTSLSFSPGSTSIAANACQGMSALTSLSVPASVTSIGSGAFTGCTSVSKLTIPSTLVMKNVFPGYASIKEIKLQPGIGSVVANAFQGCAALETISIPDGVGSIGNLAFEGCQKLSSVIVPKSVSSIGSGAFVGCPNVKMFGYAYSFAETYAKNYSIPFVLLDGGVTLVVEGPATLAKGATAKYAAKRLDGVTGSYVWSSSAPAVATIDQYGNLSAVGGGETQIMARDAQNGALFATLKLSVSDPVTAISLSPASQELQVGEVLKLSTTLTPVNATNPTLTWSSSQPTLASVSANGSVKGLAIGSARITARADNGITGTMDVTIVPPTSAIRVTTLDDQSVNAEVELEKMLQLRAVSYPAGTTVDVDWSSSDGATVSVSASGLVKGLKSGSADIVGTLKTDGSVKHSIKIRVTVPVKEVKLSQTSLSLETGEDTALVASVLPLDATEPELTWLSSAPSVVTVSAEGKLSAVGVGQAVITATAKNKVFARCEITVADPEGLGEGGEYPGDNNGGNGTTLTIYSDIGASAWLYAKQTLQLSTSVSGVSWKSSAPSYASVSKTGLVTAKKPGKTVIITAKLGTVSGVFKVKVLKKALSLKIASATAYTNGEPVQLKVSLSPKGAGYRTISWSVAGEAASISADGKLTGISDGEVLVTATLDTGKFVTKRILVRTLPSAVSLSDSEANVKIKGKLRLIATLDGSEPGLKWRSSNKKIATVSSTGQVKGVKSGMVTISCTTRNGLVASCKVRVLKKLPTATTPPAPGPTPEPSPGFAPEVAAELTENQVP